MNTKIKSNSLEMSNAMFMVVCAVITSLIVIWFAREMFNDSSTRLEINNLVEEVIRTQGNLTLVMSENSQLSGVSPIRAQQKADEAFAALKKAVEENPQRRVSLRAKQLIQDGPRHLVK